MRTADGALRDGVYAFRTIDDTRGMLARAARMTGEHNRAVVIGGGLLGLEAAHGLKHHGLEVVLVHSSDHLMNAQLSPEGGAILARKIRGLGIHVLTGARTTGVLHADDAGPVTGVRLRDKETCRAT